MTKTTETFSPYDSADYLVDVETAAAYLEAALDEAGATPQSSPKRSEPSRAPAMSASSPAGSA